MSEKRKSDGKTKHRNFKRSRYAGSGPSKLEVGMRGVLVSHDRNREKSCRIDCFKLLNYFADKLYGPESEQKTKDADSESEPEDIESALANEVEVVKKTSQNSERRFLTVRTGVNNLIFVRCKGLSPGPFVENIVDSISGCENLESSDVPRTRNVLRVHPVELTCPGYLEEMKDKIPPFLEQKLSEINKHTENPPNEFTIEYKCRNNSHLSRQEVIDAMYEKMKDSKCGWKYNCRSKDVSVIIDVLKTVCLVSVVKDYQANRKYNIRQLFLAKTDSSTTQHGDNVLQKERLNEIGDGPKEGDTETNGHSVDAAEVVNTAEKTEAHASTADGSAAHTVTGTVEGDGEVG